MAGEPDADAGGDFSDELLLERTGTGAGVKLRRVRLAIAVAAAALAGAALVAALAAAGGGGLRSALRRAAPDRLLALNEAGDKQANLATCVIDADQATFFLVQAGTAIRFAVDSCKNTATLSDRTACAGSITTVLASVGWTGSYVAGTLNSCGSSVNLGAACGASLAGLFAELGEFGFVASTIVETCDAARRLKEVRPGEQAPDGLQGSLRLLKQLSNETARASAGRLKEIRPGEQAPDSLQASLGFLKELSNETARARAAQQNGHQPLRAARVTQCIVDLNLGLTYLGRAGIQIYFLAQQCVKSGADDRKKCALNVFNVISSFAWAAQFLAQVAVDCPRVANAAKASCAAVVSDFVAAVAALGPLVNGIGDDCQPNTTQPAQLPPGSGAFE